MPGPMNRGPRGMKPQVKNPGKLLARLMNYVFRDYKIHCIFVFIFIFLGVIANVQGRIFHPLPMPSAGWLYFMGWGLFPPMRTTGSWSR